MFQQWQLADAALLEGSRVTNPVQTVEKPGDEEVNVTFLLISHMLRGVKHVKSKGKPERHERNEGRICDRNSNSVF